jgi:hypothetical protein
LGVNIGCSSIASSRRSIPQPNKKGRRTFRLRPLRSYGFVSIYKTGAQANAVWRQRQFAQAFRFEIEFIAK